MENINSKLSVEESIVQKTNPIDTSNIINSVEAKIVVENKNENVNVQPDTTIKSTISDTADILKNIDDIKDELCKLPLDPCESDYINNYINPMLNVLYQLSTTSLNLSNSVYYLTNSPIVHPKRSELEDTLHLVYNINDECEDVYKIVKKRLNIVIKAQKK